MIEKEIETLTYRIFDSDGNLVVFYDKGSNHHDIGVVKNLLYNGNQQLHVKDSIFINDEEIRKEQIQNVISFVHLDDYGEKHVKIAIDIEKSKNIIFLYSDLPIPVNKGIKDCESPYYTIKEKEDTIPKENKDVTSEKIDDTLRKVIKVDAINENTDEDEDDENTYVSELEKVKARKARIIPFIFKSVKHTFSILSLILIYTYIHMFILALGCSVNGTTFILRQFIGNHVISDSLGLIIGLGVGYFVYNSIITRLLIICLQYIHRNELHNITIDVTPDWLHEDAKSERVLDELNRIVEFENEPYVAHRLYEYIDLEQSTTSQFTIEHAREGKIKESLYSPIGQDEDLSPKHRVMANRVISDELTLFDVKKIQSVIKEYRKTKENIEYQREFYKYDKLFAEKQHESESKFVEEFEKINKELEYYYQELEDLKQEKMKDIEKKIS